MSSSENWSTTDLFRSAEQLHGQIVSKAAEDAEFRTALLSDPKGAISSEFEVYLPESFEITVHESKGTSLHLALPPVFNELSEQELGEIVGGVHPAGTGGAPPV